MNDITQILISLAVPAAVFGPFIYAVVNIARDEAETKAKANS